MRPGRPPGDGQDADRRAWIHSRRAPGTAEGDRPRGTPGPQGYPRVATMDVLPARSGAGTGCVAGGGPPLLASRSPRCVPVVRSVAVGPSGRVERAEAPPGGR